MKTKVINSTNVDINVKDGTGGVHRLLCKLEPKKFYDLQLDQIATYKEYHIFEIDKPQTATIVLSSDDLADQKTITITENNGVFEWKGTPRRDPVINEASNSQPSGVSKHFGWIPGWIRSKFQSDRSND